MNRFEALELQDWRQFRAVQMEFHPRATIITGANGSGKTTILNILSQHFGWALAFAGTLRIDSKGARRYFSGFIDDVAESEAIVGRLTYSSGASADLRVPTEGASFCIAIHGSQSVPGIYITSHRPVYTYQPVTEIPTEVHAGDQLFNQYLDTVRQFYQLNSRIHSPSHRLKAALISLATFGYGNRVVAANPETQETFEGFSKVLDLVLPPALGFRGMAIRMPEVILETATGDFSLDAASGGIAALMDVAWQIYMRSRSDDSFTVLMDEPENHLHPSLQRTVLPGLIDAFPQVQFIVSTHNPFVVTSVRDSNVIVLDFTEGRVGSTKLQDVAQSVTANQVLTNVLGIPFPVPLWVESEVDKIVDSVRDKELSIGLLSELREQLNAIGLGHLFPKVMEHLLPSDTPG